MRITLLSDIHLEFKRSFYPIISRLTNHAQTDVCVLAGDIGYCTQPIYSNFLHEAKQIFKNVIVIPGNHEYLTKEPMIDTDKRIAEICNKHSCIFLNKSTIELDNHKFIGCTLWSDVSNTTRPNKLLSDLHRDHLQWLKSELSKNQKSVVITHHCPSFDLITNKYPLNPNSVFYYSNLNYLINKPIQAWLCGHSHHQNHIIVNDVPIFMNPIGLEHENSEWNSELYIDID